LRSVKEIIVCESNQILDALEILNETGFSILILVDVQNKFLRTITDGDIRRLLLDGFSLRDSLSNLPKNNSLVLPKNSSSSEAIELMKEFQISQVPVIDDDKVPIGIFLKTDIEQQIFLSSPHMGGYEKDFVDQAFDSNWIAPLGPNVDGFEKEFSSYVNSKYSLAVNSGTAALHLSLILLGVKSGDIVFCSSFTFVASANPILYQGATPVFIDSEPSSWCMSPVALESGIEEYLRIGKRPKAIVVVHIYGQSANMAKILEISNKYDIPIIEDAAESLGTRYKKQHTGTFGKLGIFSFNGNKIITTSGGGMLVSDDPELISKGRFLATQAKDLAPYYEHSEVGYNYRMSNILAGVGRGQLRVIETRIEQKREIFKRYKEYLEPLGFTWLEEDKNIFSNYWLSACTINKTKSNISPKFLIQELKKFNIEARHTWKPMHLQKLFRNYDYYQHQDRSICDSIFENGICLPSSSSMTNDQQELVISKIFEITKKMK